MLLFLIIHNCHKMICLLDNKMPFSCNWITVWVTGWFVSVILTWLTSVHNTPVRSLLNMFLLIQQLILGDRLCTFNGKFYTHAYYNCCYVNSTLLLLVRMITEYCSCADNLPMLTTDIVTKLTDLLKVYHTGHHISLFPRPKLCQYTNGTYISAKQ